MTVTVTHDDLLTVFDEFAGTPTAKIDFWLDDAKNSLSEAIFGDSLKKAILLYAAHNIAMSKQAASSGGAASGPVSSKSVAPVSKSYDTGSVAIANAGTWNYTSYGQRLIQLWKGCMAGPIYIPGNDRFPTGLLG